MKRLEIFLISIFFTIGISLFSSVSSKTVKATAPLFMISNYSKLISQS